MKDLILKYKEVILFLFVGVLTSIVSYSSYYLFACLIMINYLISNILSWIVTVLFAFYANKYYVFRKKSTKNILKELLLFANSRIFTGIVEVILLFICVEFFYADDLISKFLIGFFTAVLNYFISRILIFKEKGQ